MGPPRSDWRGRESGHEDGEPGVHRLGVRGVGGAQGDAWPAREPGGKAAVVPFGADVGPGAHDDVEAALAGELDEAREVAPTVEIGPAGPGLMEVPRHVGVEGVGAHGGEAVEPILPLLRVHAEGVDGAGADPVGRGVAQQAALDQGQAGHLMAPAVRPARQKRCRERKATTMISPAGACWPVDPAQPTRPTVTGCIEVSLRTMSGRR